MPAHLAFRLRHSRYIRGGASKRVQGWMEHRRDRGSPVWLGTLLARSYPASDLRSASARARRLNRSGQYSRADARNEFRLCSSRGVESQNSFACKIDTAGPCWHCPCRSEASVAPYRHPDYDGYVHSDCEPANARRGQPEKWSVGNVTCPSMYISRCPTPT